MVISRFLTTASNIFHTPIEKNKQMINVLQESYLNLGGSEVNMKVWLLIIKPKPIYFVKFFCIYKGNTRISPGAGFYKL